MRLFLYEYITGGGLLELDLNSAEVPASLLAEGKAMITALATDALMIPGFQVTLLWDHRLPPPDLPESCLQGVADPHAAAEAFQKANAESQGTILIAPESDSTLFDCAVSALEFGGRLWSPSPDVIELCSDKQRTADHLAKCEVPVPLGVSLEPNQELPIGFPSPAVLKPIDGCGSQGLQLITKDEIPESWSVGRCPDYPVRMEPFLPGLPASVSVLCGPKQQIALPACKQHLSADGTFAYEGGSLPLDRKLAQRAEALALRAIRSLPQPRGYLGVDLILGPAADGSDDAVIEINPRLTTSYVGLRQATADNLVQAWMKLMQGEPVSLQFASEEIQFRADGQITK